ncbi:helix-turn-helix domain-containing protein [Kitasatospora sp. NPDC048545]|uniref:helix-turn-helix domain-containing protein n=1 Tax=Kitasatospora sp. NPDC048545 TaxID=3157208 RepID=UPI003410F39F
MRLNVEYLREAAAQAGDGSDYTIARRLNVSQSTISRWVNGKCSPSARAQASIRGAYGVSLDDLMIGNDIPAAA